jgi:hypothetical protein
MNKHTDILKMLSEAPDGHISNSITPKLLALSGQPSVASDELLAILDECAYASLASEFGMVAMNSVWRQIYQEEGITEEQAHIAAKPRRDLWEAGMR